MIDKFLTKNLQKQLKENWTTNWTAKMELVSLFDVIYLCILVFVVVKTKAQLYWVAWLGSFLSYHI